MMDEGSLLQSEIQSKCGALLVSVTLAVQELTIEVLPENLLTLCYLLRDDPEFSFEMLMDVSGVDYLHYGLSEWATEDATETAFSRGRMPLRASASTVGSIPESPWKKPRFCVVYHLLSLTRNRRLRLKTFPTTDPPLVPSVIPVWNSANWYEREIFDLYGILFEGHPDLRRILTDYGFIGHPFRKDFPLIGEVELRYSAKDERVIYEPVTVTPRVLEPKIIRQDNRYNV